MKTKKVSQLLVFFMLLSFAFVACDDENHKSVVDKVELKKMVSFEDAEVGVLQDETPVILVSKKQILMFAEETLKDTKLNLKPFDYKIIDENNKKYLRIYSNDNYVSTIELVVTDSNVLRTGKTVCTSTACASSGGCIPDGSYCTPCIDPRTQGQPGDCVRTTSGGLTPP
jgi:hypothetical protein